jgi:N-acetylmuramoyl-L-alanine amidase
MAGNPDRVRDLRRLAEIWEDRLGLRVKTIRGWEDRGAPGNTFEVLGCHHTAITIDADRLLVDGSAALSGPLCNVALHANGDVVLVASGRANHFGCATWPNARSLGVEATGPQNTGPKFPNRDAYARLAAGFCIFKSTDPRHVVRGDVGIPVHLVAAHKEVAVGVPDPARPGFLLCNQQTRKIYGRKIDPDFGDADQVKAGVLAHGFSVRGSGVRLIDSFRDDVHARMTEEDDMTVEEFVRELNKPGSPARTAIRELAGMAVDDKLGVPNTADTNARKGVKDLTDRSVQDLERAVRDLHVKLDALAAKLDRRA